MKVQTLEFPHMHPGKCALCGASHKRDGRQYIDFGLSVLKYGVVYLCTVCVVEIAGSLGWINPAIASSLKGELLEFKDKFRLLEDENERLRNSLANLDFLGTNISPEPDIVEATLGYSSEQRQPNSDSGPDNTGSKKPEQGSPEQDNERGSTGVQRSELANSI